MSKRRVKRIKGDKIKAVQTYLRNNPGSNLTSAYKAVGYTGPPLKIKEGNLTDKRSSVRLATRGDAGNVNRRASMRLRPPQTKEEVNRNRQQENVRRNINAKGGKVVIDHKVDLSLLRSTVEGMSPEQAQQKIQQLEQSYGPLGNRPDNRQIISAKTNELKRQQQAKVQQKLQQMNGSVRLGFQDMTGGYTGADSLPRRVDMDPFGTGSTIMVP
jgi:hypothetical protein